MPNRWIMTGLAATLVALGLLTNALAETDYSSIPPDPAALAKALSSGKTDVLAAIEQAEKRIGGKATAARVKAEDGKLLILVDVTAPGITARVTIDSATGRLADPADKPAESKVPLSSAIKAAEKSGAGKAVAAGLERVPVSEPEPGAERPPDTKLEIGVEVLNDKARTKVMVDPDSGDPIFTDDLPTARFPGEAVSGEPIKTASGLMYYELKVGEGPLPKPDSTVQIHHTTWFTDGSRLDSTVDRGQPANFPLNKITLKGLAEGVSQMRVGGKRKLILPYRLAFGEAGRPPIPPKAALIIDVELLDVLGGPTSAPTRPSDSDKPATRPAKSPGGDRRAR